MARAYKGIVLAFGAILTWHHPNAKAQPQQDTTQESGGGASESVTPRNYEHTERAGRSRENQQCDQGEEKRYSDLCAQWKAADAAADSAWWAAISGYATAISTFAVLVALYFAFRSNSIARDTARHQLRAYVAFETIEAKLPTLIEYPYEMQVIWRNTGQTPASSLANKTIIRVLDAKFDGDLTDIIRALADAPDVGSFVVGPNHAVYGEHLELPLSDFRAIAKGTKRGFALGTVTYLDIFGRDARQTDFCVEMKIDGTTSDIYFVPFGDFNRMSEQPVRHSWRCPALKR